jgi:hypothetical protein
MTEPLSIAASLAVRHVGAYADLIRSDLNARETVVHQRIAAAGVLMGALLLAAALACVWIIALSWDGHGRNWAIAGLLGFFICVAAAALWRVKSLNAAAPGLLAQTAQEWSKDRRLLLELLARGSQETP